MGRQRVTASGAVDEDGVLVGFAQGRGFVFVTRLVAQPNRIHLMPFGGPHPAFFRQHHGHRIGGHQLGFIQGPGLGTHHDGRSAVITELIHVFTDFFDDLFFQLGIGVENGFQLFAFCFQLILLTTDFELFQLGQIAQANIQDGFGLNVGNAKAFHHHRLGFILGADNMNHLIDIEVGNQQAFQDMQAVQHFIQAILQTPAHGGDPELQPLAEHIVQALHTGPAIVADYIKIDAIGTFQVGGGEQVPHQLLHVHPVGTGCDHQAGGIFMVRFIPQIAHHGQLFLVHLVGDLFQYLVAGHLVRQRRHNHITVFQQIAGPHAQGTAPGHVHFDDVIAGGNDFRIGGEIRALNDVAQIIHRAARVFQQLDTGIAHFPQVVGWNIRGHAHGNAHGAVQQYIGQPRRQHHRLFQGTVEVRLPLHRALAQFTQQHIRIGRQAGFGVTHGGEGFRIVR